MNIGKKTFPLLILLALILAGCADTARPVPSIPADADLAAGCPVTQPPDPAFVPPQPYPAQPPGDEFVWYGSDALWTVLPIDGSWYALPRDGEGWGTKSVWWRAGYDALSEQQPDLTINLYRYGESAPAASFSDATHGWEVADQPFILIGITFPEAGCWQVQAEYEGQQLSYWVEIGE
jgi:hypothetical protein